MAERETTMHADGASWPEGISDGLTLPCGRCGCKPRFDYRVSDSLWQRIVPAALRLGVVCLPCLDELADTSGEDVSETLESVQWTGIGKTVLLYPAMVHRYAPAPAPASAPEEEHPDDPECVEDHCPICGEYESECICAEQDAEDAEEWPVCDLCHQPDPLATGGYVCALCAALIAAPASQGERERVIREIAEMDAINARALCAAVEGRSGGPKALSPAERADRILAALGRTPEPRGEHG